MSDPIGTPENPVKVKYDIDLPVSDELRYEDVATGKLRVIEDELGNKFTYDEWGHKVPVFAPGTSRTVRGAGFVSYEGIPDIGVPSEDVEGEFDLRVDLGNGQFEEWDYDSAHSNFNSLLTEAFSALGYNDALIGWLKGQWKNFTFVDDLTIDVRAALAAYNAFLIKSPMYEDEYFREERSYGEPREEAYGIDYRQFRDAMIDAIQSAKGGGIATEQARLAEEKKQTEYLAKLAAAAPKVTPLTLEGIGSYLTNWLREGQPEGGEKSVEGLMALLGKVTTVGKTLVLGSSLVENYKRSSDLESRANQAFLAEDYNAYDRLELQAYRMGNRTQSGLVNLLNTITSGTAYQPVRAVKEPAAYVKKAAVPKYKTYKTSALAMPKATAKAIADKQSAKIKALEAKVKSLTESFKKLKGQA